MNLITDWSICVYFLSEFKENVSDFAKSFGVSQNVDILIPAFIHKSFLMAHASALKSQHKDNEQLALLGESTNVNKLQCFYWKLASYSGAPCCRDSTVKPRVARYLATSVDIFFNPTSSHSCLLI
jgi:hypothetical protein